jgi:hypothetical protein
MGAFVPRDRRGIGGNPPPQTRSTCNYTCSFVSEVPSDIFSSKTAWLSHDLAACLCRMAVQVTDDCPMDQGTSTVNSCRLIDPHRNDFEAVPRDILGTQKDV